MQAFYSVLVLAGSFHSFASWRSCESCLSDMLSFDRCYKRYVRYL